jgi:hypothetical protein
MRDRAARATVRLSLFTKGAAPPPVIRDPEAKVFPGVRGSFLYDIRGDESASYLGGGLDLGVTQAIYLEVLGLRSLEDDAKGMAGVLVTINGRLYSQFFGDGERPFANPYLGLRAGYARFLQKNEALLGAALGLELVKSKRFLLDLEFRSYALFGSKAGGHVGLEPTLGASLAF